MIRLAGLRPTPLKTLRGFAPHPRRGRTRPWTPAFFADGY